MVLAFVGDVWLFIFTRGDVNIRQTDAYRDMSASLAAKIRVPERVHLVPSLAITHARERSSSDGLRYAGEADGYQVGLGLHLYL